MLACIEGCSETVQLLIDSKAKHIANKMKFLEDMSCNDEDIDMYIYRYDNIYIYNVLFI